MKVSVFGPAGLPTECRNGHPWGPGKVLIGWLPCGCRGGRGHTWAACEEPGCGEVWYYPWHRKAASGDAGRSGSGPGAPLV